MICTVLYYISTGDQLCRDVKPGETVEVPLFASFMTDRQPGKQLVLKTELYGWNTFGERESYHQSNQEIPFEPWMAKALSPLKITMPEKPALAVLALCLENEAGVVLQRNFTTFLVANGSSPRGENNDGVRVVRFAPDQFQGCAVVAEAMERSRRIESGRRGTRLF